jgi:RND family efflux transporter MFP subunit
VGCRQQAATKPVAAEPPAVSVPVIRVAKETLLSAVRVTGSLVSSSQVDIKAETIGRITRFDKEEGDTVAAGESIVWVNDENSQLALRQAETAIKVVDAALERARLLQSHGRAELERAENLLKSGGITDKDLQAARIAEQDASAQVAVAAAQREEAQASLDVARKRTRDAVIHSPVPGTIQRKYINKGAYVEAPTALFAVVDNTRLELNSPVAAVDLAPLRQGQRVAFTVNTYPGEKFEGEVLEIAPSVDAETRSVKVRIRVSNSANKLKAGMFAEGEIQTGSNTQAIVIPAGAIYRDDRSSKSSYVFVVERGKALRREVRIGHERDGRLEITEGLKPGDQVIAEQSIQIAEGVRIEPRS